MRRPAVAVARAAALEPAFHEAHVPVAGRPILGVEEAGPLNPPSRPGGADQPRSATSVPVTRTEENGVRVVDTGGLGHLGGTVASSLRSARFACDV
jgi:hypothetical protein